MILLSSSPHKITSRHRLADKLRLQWNSRWLPGTLWVSLENIFLLHIFLRISFVISSNIFADVLSIVVSFGWTPVSLTPRRIITSKVIPSSFVSCHQTETICYQTKPYLLSNQTIFDIKLKRWWRRRRQHPSHRWLFCIFCISFQW